MHVAHALRGCRYLQMWAQHRTCARGGRCALSIAIASQCNAAASCGDSRALVCATARRVSLVLCCTWSRKGVCKRRVVNCASTQGSALPRRHQGTPSRVCKAGPSSLPRSQAVNKAHRKQLNFVAELPASRLCPHQRRRGAATIAAPCCPRRTGSDSGAPSPSVQPCIPLFCKQRAVRAAAASVAVPAERCPRALRDRRFWQRRRASKRACKSATRTPFAV